MATTRRHKLLYFVSAICLILSLAVARSVGNQSCSSGLRYDQAFKINGQEINVQRAESELDRQKGLSGRDCLGQGEGMLFVFEKPGFYGFWMKNTLVPLDIIWISESKKVVHQELNVAPSSYPKSFVNTKPAKYVLELPAGQATQLGLDNDVQLNF